MSQVKRTAKASVSRLAHMIQREIEHEAINGIDGVTKCLARLASALRFLSEVNIGGGDDDGWLLLVYAGRIERCVDVLKQAAPDA